MKKEKTLLQIFLIPLLAIGGIAGTLPLLLLVLSGIRPSMEQNIIRMDQHTVENRKVVLENEMIEHWRRIYKESDGLSTELSEILDSHGIDITGFLGNHAAQQEYLEQIFPDMVETLQYNTASGLFLILANDESIAESAEYQGFFLRDSDPQTRIVTNSDLLLERGSKKLSQSCSIPLDSAWSTNFHFDGEGVRSADDFFYTPYVTAVENPDIAMENLGYWSRPFILEDHYMDKRQIITYSVPLLYGDTVYGVLGVEIGVDELTGYFPVKDLDNDLNAGYALAILQNDGSLEGVAGKGVLYDAVTRQGKDFSLLQTSDSEICQVKGAMVGQQGIYCVYSPLSLYSSNVPYDDTEWVLCGFVTEESIYGFGTSIYQRMVFAALCSLLIAFGCICLLTHYVTKPVYRLVESVRGGLDGIHNFKTSHIIEIDELHDVVENLTELQRQNEEQLIEEKERYRVAVENSRDMFFIFRVKEGLLEIVNSKGKDGVWDCREHPEYIKNDHIYAEDQRALYAILEHKGREFNLDFRLKSTEEGEYRWVNLTASLLRDADGELTRIVGCVRDIHQRKLLEEAEKKRQYYDSLTGFYRLEYGLRAIENCPASGENNVLLLVDIRQFTALDEQYGLIFGDVLVEQLSKILHTASEEMEMKGTIEIRAGADQLMLFVPGTDAPQAKKLAQQALLRFSSLVKERYYAISFCCGIAETGRFFNRESDMARVMGALQEAKYKKKAVVLFEERSDRPDSIPAVASFAEIDPVNHLSELSLSSLAMNLLDRGNNLTVILDVLTLKLRENYEFDNLVITNFLREELAESCTYLFKEGDPQLDGSAVIHCTESEYQRFIHNAAIQEMYPVGEENGDAEWIGVFSKEKGVIYHMLDNGQYSGSILFVGMDPEILREETRKKQLEEIAVIIQNKVNLQRHDLSAKAKSDFLARMSHEIRTPMNGIIGMTEIALRDGQSEERRMDCLRKIASSSNYLLGLLNDILDMSKIENGKMKLVVEKCNLKALFGGLRPLMESKIAEKSISFEQDIRLKHTFFLCDGLRLNQVLVNFLSNAMKYCSMGGHVWLTAQEEVLNETASVVTFAVRDDGVGIEKEKQQLIFQQFEQADYSENARRQGTGLGLAISSRLVHMMDSDIELQSEAGKGSTFRFSVKLQPVNAEETSGDVAASTVDFAGKRVLAVEDNALNMEIIRTLLEEYGMIVDEAYNGQEAVSLMEEVSPWYYDLILMDIMMPVMDGLEATRRIRRIDREDCCKIPIVAMSANAFDEDVKRSLASGMNGHLSKPVNIEKLKTVLAQQWCPKG